jgi:histidine kinase
MIDYIRHRLGVKLLLSYLAILIVIVSVMVIVIPLSVPYAYNHYMMDTGTVPGSSMMGQGPMGIGRGQGLANFRNSIFEALAYAMLVATVVVALVSLFFSRSVVAPLRKMTFASQRIAKGNYDERVRVDGVDELAELSDSFNQMAVQLEQVESMRRKLLGDVSHELRTPLTAIKGYMEGLIDGVIPAEPETFLQIHAEADRLSRLVDDLQELSRVESKAYVLDFQPLDISLLVDTAIRRLVTHAREKQIELRSDLPIDLPFVFADTDRITQVLINLIGNAIAYTPVNGSVTISGSWRGDKVKIAVTDTGIGISPEHLPHVFDRFYRVDKSRSRQAGGGSGIGLTIARHLVEAHGGSIWVESAGEGQGSTFIFTTPAAN